MEGARRNLLANHDVVLAALANLDPSVEYSRPSALGDAPTWSFSAQRAAGRATSMRAESVEGGRDYVFSGYSWMESASAMSLDVGLSGGTERSRVLRALTSRPERFEVSHRFAESPCDLRVELGVVGTDASAGKVFVAFPAVEAALFASTPVDCGLERATELLSFPRAGGFFEGEQGTVIIVFTAEWSGHQLSEKAKPCLLWCGDDARQNAVALFVNGSRGGRLTAQIVCDGLQSTVECAVVPQQHFIHAVSLRWTGGIADILVDGWPNGSVSGIPFPRADSLGAQVYIGNRPDTIEDGLFGGILSIQSAPAWLDDLVIQGTLFESHPEVFAQFRNAAQLTSERELTRFSADTWALPIIRNLLRYPDLWQSHPPSWLQDDERTSEEEFRDEITRSLGGSGYGIAPEAHSEQGRTDLLVMIGEHRLRMEFKVWGRHDYAAVPLKPLCYLTSSESMAAVLMINPRKTIRIGQEYRNNVLNSPTECIGLVNRPFGDSFPDHFVSTHRGKDGEVEVLHVVMDKFGPFVDGS